MPRPLGLQCGRGNRLGNEGATNAVSETSSFLGWPNYLLFGWPIAFFSDASRLFDHMPRKFDADIVAEVLQQWTDGARERLDAMIDSDANVLDIRDSLLFLSGCLCGSLQMAGLPMDQVNTATHNFQEALDLHLCGRFPQHSPTIWKHNALN